jgi:hypothetical protein
LQLLPRVNEGFFYAIPQKAVIEMYFTEDRLIEYERIMREKPGFDFRTARQQKSGHINIDYMAVKRNLKGVLTMKVLLVKPEKTACEADIGESLEAMQKAVGGYIEACYPYEDLVALVCNEEGKINGLKPNRAVYDDHGKMVDIICGDFFICGLNRDNFKSLPPDMMEKYRKKFEHPELFINVQGKIMAVKNPEKNTRPNSEKHKEKEPER